MNATTVDIVWDYGPFKEETKSFAGESDPVGIHSSIVRTICRSS